MPINFQQPQGAEIEVSLFGPGTGECIVAHLGSGKWMVVDSCTNKITGRPIALEYLEGLGVKPINVVLVVVTHFHDDHIGGITEVVRHCTEARVVISEALMAEESWAFALAYSLSDVISDRGKPSTHEIVKLAEVMRSNDRSFSWAGDSKCLYRDEQLVVHSLSPSDAAVSQARLDFCREFDKATMTFRKLANKLTPNFCAVALHVCNGLNTVLLGSDLEVCASNSLGWRAVVASPTRPTTLAQVFKIPHHGSRNGHCDDVVARMLVQMPISILTTMDSSHLPREDDIKRIKAYSGSLYQTTTPKIKPPKRDRAVEELMGTVVVARRVIPKVMGHIQIRMCNGAYKIECNEHASEVA